MGNLIVSRFNAVLGFAALVIAALAAYYGYYFWFYISSGAP